MVFKQRIASIRRRFHDSTEPVSGPERVVCELIESEAFERIRTVDSITVLQKR